jgi:hypothetical protein
MDDFVTGNADSPQIPKRLKAENFRVLQVMYLLGIGLPAALADTTAPL